VVPQLRDTAGWLAALVPEIFHTILVKDPESLFLADDPPLAEQDRADLVRRILQAYDAGELVDERLIRTVGSRQRGARLSYPGLANDLRGYIRGEITTEITVRRVAILIAELTQQSGFDQDLVEVALDGDEPHPVRTMAVFAIGRIGGEIAKASLKRLVTAVLVDDPDDELKGGALMATWPNHLTGEELFSALTPRKKAHLNGLYQKFLWSNFTSSIQPNNTCIALDWARLYVNSSPAEVNPFRNAGLAVTLVSIQHFRLPGVSERLADILLERACSSIHHDSVAADLLANEPARHAIGTIAIQKASDVWTARLLFRLGLIAASDIEFLIDELPKRDIDVQEKIAFLIADIFCATMLPTPTTLDQVLCARRDNPVLSRVFGSILDTVELGSPEADRQKSEFERSYRGAEEAPLRESPPQLDDLLDGTRADNDAIFADICYRLTGINPSWHSPNEELLPHWGRLASEHQNHIVEAAERYVKRDCPVADLSWIGRAELPYAVMYGFWALRLLCVKSRMAFGSLSDHVWHSWMPSVFGEPYSDHAADEWDSVLLRTAYRKVPERFFEVLDLFIEGAHSSCGFVLNRVVPVCPEAVALLRRRLQEGKLKTRSFENVLSTLFRGGDDVAVHLATELVTSITADLDVGDGRRRIAAMQLLSRDAISGWQIVWRAVEANTAFANELFAPLALDPYSSPTSELLKHLREDQLADMYIWLAEHGAAAHQEYKFGVITPQKALVWLGRVVLTHLGDRGTAAASREIRRIKERLPGEPLDFISKTTDELVRRNTWRPMSIAQLIPFNDGKEKPTVRSNPGAVDKRSMEEESKTSRNVQIQGPNETELLIFPHGESFLWKIRSKSLRRVENVRLRIDDIETLDFEKLEFREPEDFKFLGPLISVLPAGAETKNFIFLRFENDLVGVGNQLGRHILAWPSGDQGSVRTWRLNLKVNGLSEEWTIDLRATWTVGSKIIELVHVKPATRAQTIPSDETPPETETEELLRPIREWNDLTITFTSDERVMVKFTGADAETRNYGEMGFADGRGGKPCRAWIMLRDLSSELDKSMRMDKKDAQDVRRRLRNFFSIDSNPILFEKRLGYRARFKLYRSPSFDT